MKIILLRLVNLLEYVYENIGIEYLPGQIVVGVLAVLVISVTCHVILCVLGHFRRQPIKQEILKDSGLLVPPVSLLDMAKLASRHEDAELLIEILENACYDINYPVTSSGLTLFLCSCISGKRRLVEYLLKRGANIHSTTYDGDSALYLATYGILKNNAKMVDSSLLELLIKMGCEVNSENKSGYTPLHHAVRQGNCSVIKCLLRWGAKLSATTKTGISPMHIAQTRGNRDVINLLQVCSQEE